MSKQGEGDYSGFFPLSKIYGLQEGFQAPMGFEPPSPLPNIVIRNLMFQTESQWSGVDIILPGRLYTTPHRVEMPFYMPTSGTRKLTTIKTSYGCPKVR